MPKAKKQGGFTLIEIIVSIILIPLLWLAISTAMAVNTVMISTAKHRAQAIFVAQENMDRDRENGYAALAVVTGQTVTLDTRGTHETADDFTGFMDITLGPSPSGHYGSVLIRIYWFEKMVDGSLKGLQDGLMTYISDDPAG